MRNLTIQRAKTWVGAISMAKVYIEDPSGELEIRGVRCRKLGIVKNGGEATFQIGDEAAKIFVIGDKLSRNMCNDYYPLPEGQEDVVLTGKNKFDLLVGNAFRFDENDSSEVAENRKEGRKHGVMVIITACIVGIMIGMIAGPYLVYLDASKPKTFSDRGFTITLHGGFRKAYDTRFTACYRAKDAAVFALKEPFSTMEGLEGMTLEQYGALVIQKNSLLASQIKTEGDLTYFTYESADGSSFYLAFLFKQNDAFWLVQCATNADQAETYTPLFLQWAESIKLS